jgi:protein disulfide-isomerase
VVPIPCSIPLKIILRLLAGCIAALLVAAAARAADWTEDYSSALAKAKKEHKFLLLNFTGSDWCGWCKRTDAEVFSTPKFEAFASRRLVLVMVDFPRSRPLKDEVKAQNAGLQQKYGIRGFPTLIVLDPSERVVFKQEGYEEGGTNAFLAKFPKWVN